MEQPAIKDYAIIGDCRTAALISRAFHPPELSQDRVEHIAQRIAGGFALEDDVVNRLVPSLYDETTLSHLFEP